MYVNQYMNNNQTSDCSTMRLLCKIKLPHKCITIIPNATYFHMLLRKTKIR